MIWALALTGFSQDGKAKRIPANSASITYLGRTLIGDGGEVTFDWPGTYFQFMLTGESCSMRASDTGESYYNVFADGQLVNQIMISSRDTTVQLVSKLNKKKAHHIIVQKKSEGEFGRTTLHEFVVAKDAVVKQYLNKRSRFIEFIGDSYTVGYGTDGKHRDEPFAVATENANKTYARMVADYFDADYALIAHSGRGAVRNYGDSLAQSAYTMKNAMMNTLNSDTSTRYSFAQYKPDLVVINLGINDFSTLPNPSQLEFQEAYRRIINQVQHAYGSKVKILCVIPYLGGALEQYINNLVADLKDPNIGATASLRGVINSDSDMGAAWHPGYAGHQKMATFMIPYVSTFTGWQMEDRFIK